MIIIGVDVGATKIASGVLDQNAQMLQSLKTPTLAFEDCETVLNQVYKAIDNLDFDKNKLKGIGICAPGPLRNGIIINPPNIPSWQNLSLAKIIKDKYNVPVLLENDANAAAYAEMIFGSAKGYNNFVYVTVSTGIGTGIIIDRKIYRGKNGLAGEGGHLTINYQAPIDCNCGVPGCIESLASGTAIAKQAQDNLKNNLGLQTSLKNYELDQITTREINEVLEKENDEFAKDLIEQAAYKISIWLGGVVSLLDPEAIIIGGGVAQGLAGNILFEKIKQSMPKFTINAFANQTPIIPAALKKQVGVYGAASLMYDL